MPAPHTQRIVPFVPATAVSPPADPVVLHLSQVSHPERPLLDALPQDQDLDWLRAFPSFPSNGDALQGHLHTPRRCQCMPGNADGCERAGGPRVTVQEAARPLQPQPHHT